MACLMIGMFTTSGGVSICNTVVLTFVVSHRPAILVSLPIKSKSHIWRYTRELLGSAGSSLRERRTANRGPYYAVEDSNRAKESFYYGLWMLHSAN